MPDTSSTNAHTDAAKGKGVVKSPSNTRIFLFLVVFLVVAAAIAVPIGIVFWPDDDSPQLSVQVTFTANGDVSDYSPQATQDAILGTLSTAAGFAAVPVGSTLTLTSGSVVMVADFPVATVAAQDTAKAALDVALPDQTTAQTLLRTAVPTIVIESVVSVDNNDGSGPAPPPPPFALAGHWISNYGTGVTYTNDYVISMSSYGRSLLPITSYTSTYYIIRRPANDAYNPGAFQKVFFHTHTDGSIATCTSGNEAPFGTGFVTEAAAIAHDGVGIYYSNTTQCGPFSHSFHTPYTIPIAGSWTGGGESITITDDTWTSVASWGTTERTIFAFSSSAIIAQMPADDTYNPSAWNLIQYHASPGTSSTANGFSHCTTVYNAATMLEAINYDEAGNGAYNSANATHGCGTSGFSHSVATRVV
jgi:hypothetical protein